MLRIMMHVKIMLTNHVNMLKTCAESAVFMPSAGVLFNISNMLRYSGERALTALPQHIGAWSNAVSGAE